MYDQEIEDEGEEGELEMEEDDDEYSLIEGVGLPNNISNQ